MDSCAPRSPPAAVHVSEPLLGRQWLPSPQRLFRHQLRGFDGAVSQDRWRRIFGSVLWLLSERGLQTAAQVLVGLWMVRYLGPTGFGQLSYCLAFAFLANTAARAGLEAVVTRDLASGREMPGRILATALILRVGSSVAVGALILAFALLVEGSESDIRFALLMVALVPVAQCGDVVQWWFNSQTRAKLSVLTRNAALLAASLVRVGLILQAASWPLFVTAMIVESIVGSLVGLIFGLRFKIPRLALAKVKWEDLRRLLARSAPLLVASLAVLVYMYADVVMLKIMRGSEDAGFYAGAVRISEIAYILPLAIVGSINPTIIEVQGANLTAHAELVRALIRFTVPLMFVLSVVGVALADTAVSLLLGPAYSASVAVLRIHIWTLPFVAMGMIASALLVNQRAERVVLAMTSLGALLNVSLNFLLIPHFGGPGCAVATMLAQIGSSLGFLPLLGPQARAVLRCFVVAARPARGRCAGGSQSGSAITGPGEVQ
jgi:polysaccharide transporter, PST family